jgi:predicted  nucleic acid-binding Zn-ribbon protein
VVATKIVSFIENKFALEISLAKANGYEAVMLSSDGEYDLINIEDISDKEYILDVASEFGWDKFIIINITGDKPKSKLIKLSLIEAA